MASQFLPSYEDDFNEIDERQSDQHLYQSLPSAADSVKRFPATRVVVKKQKLPTAYRPVNERNVSGKSQLRELGKRSLTGTANRSLKLPPVRATRNDFRAGTDVNDRVLSAKARRVQDLENERNSLRAEVEDLTKEIRVLKQMMRRQEKALQQYEGKDEQTSFLRSEEEGRILREHLRQARQKYAQIRELNRELEMHSVDMERDRDKLAAIVRDHQLLDSKALKDERDQLAAKLSEAEVKIKELERQTHYLRKSQDRSQNTVVTKLKQQLNNYENVMAKNILLKEQLNRPQGTIQKPSKRSSTLSNQPLELRKSSISGKGEPDDNEILMRSVPKETFLKRFRHVTTESSEQPNNEYSGSASETSAGDLKSTRENASSSQYKEQHGERSYPPNTYFGSTTNEQPHPINRWKAQTSPDLLKDHNQSRILFSQHEVAPMHDSTKLSDPTVDSNMKQKLLDNLSTIDNPRSSSGIISDRFTNDRFVNEVESVLKKEMSFEKSKKEASAKNELLEKIRFLNLEPASNKMQDQFGPGVSAFNQAALVPDTLARYQGKNDSVGLGSWQQGSFLDSESIAVKRYSPQRVANDPITMSDDEVEEIEYF